MRKSIFIIIFLLCLCLPRIFAENPENQTKTIILSPNLEKTVFLNTEYTSLFRIEIKDKKPCTPKDSISVFYNVSKGDFTMQDTFTKEIGCTTSAGTGKLVLTAIGNYTLCGTIINSSVAGTYPAVSSCTEFEVIDTSATSCDLQLQIKTNQTIFYQHGQSIEFKPELNNHTFSFVIEYWIEDLFGEIVKPKINTTNTNQKSWKTNIKEQDRVLFLKAVVYPACNDGDYSNNVAEEMFIVTKDETATELFLEEVTLKDSSIKIIKITPEKASFGESVNTELEIYKGDTEKYSISLWAEKDGKIISEKTKVHVKEKNTRYKLTLPVLIEPNCEERIKEGDAQLIVEGLGLKEEKEFVLEGINTKICPEKEEKSEKSGKKSTKIEKIKEQIKSANQSVSLLAQAEQSPSLFTTEKIQKKEVSGYEGIVIYESVSEKSKNVIPWVLFIAFGLLSLVLIIKGR